METVCGGQELNTSLPVKALGHYGGYKRAYLQLGFGACQDKKIVPQVF